MHINAALRKNLSRYIACVEQARDHVDQLALIPELIAVRQGAAPLHALEDDFGISLQDYRVLGDGNVVEELFGVPLHIMRPGEQAECTMQKQLIMNQDTCIFDPRNIVKVLAGTSHDRGGRK